MDVDLSRRILTVRKTKNGDPTRHVPLNAIALEAFHDLRRRGKGKGPVFGDTESVYIKNTREWFVPCAKKAGLEDGYTWHCNRHSFGSRLTMAGVDLRTVAQLMGHRNIQMTMRYSHLAPDHQQNAVDRLVESSRSVTSTQSSTAINKAKRQSA